MTDTQFTEINTAGRVNLVKWLSKKLAADAVLHAAAFAETFIENYDGGDPDCSQNIEVCGFHTRSGNPEIYDFDTGELDLVTVDDMGDEIAREVI